MITVTGAEGSSTETSRNNRSIWVLPVITLFGIVAGSAVELQLSRWFPDVFTLSLNERVATLPIVSFAALALLTGYTLKITNTFSLIRFLIFPGIIMFIFELSVIMSSKPFSWKVVVFLNLLGSHILISVLGRSRKISYHYFDLITAIYILFSLLIFIPRLVIMDFDVQLARGGLNLYTISNVIIIWLMRVIVVDRGRPSMLQRSSILILSLVSANRLGSVLALLIFFLRSRVKTIIVSVMLALLLTFFLIARFELTVDDVYVLTRFLQGIEFTNLTWSHFSNIFFSSRGEIWTETIDLVVKDPLLGFGLGAYSDYSSIDVGSSHNLFLNNFFQFGLPFGIVVNLWFLLVFWPRRKGEILPFGCLILMVGLSGTTLVQPVGLLSVLNLIIVLLATNYRLRIYGSSR